MAGAAARGAWWRVRHRLPCVARQTDRPGLQHAQSVLGVGPGGVCACVWRPAAPSAHQQEAVLAAQGGQAGQVGKVAVHGEEGVCDDHGAGACVAEGGPAWQRNVQTCHGLGGSVWRASSNGRLATNSVTQQGSTTWRGQGAEATRTTPGATAGAARPASRQSPLRRLCPGRGAHPAGPGSAAAAPGVAGRCGGRPAGGRRRAAPGAPHPRCWRG